MRGQQFNKVGANMSWVLMENFHVIWLWQSIYENFGKFTKTFQSCIKSKL